MKRRGSLLEAASDDIHRNYWNHTGILSENGKKN
jgi:hypothetical protein